MSGKGCKGWTRAEALTDALTRDHKPTVRKLSQLELRGTFDRLSRPVDGGRCDKLAWLSPHTPATFSSCRSHLLLLHRLLYPGAVLLWVSLRVVVCVSFPHAHVAPSSALPDYWLQDRRRQQHSRSSIRRRGHVHHYSSTTVPNMRSSSTQGSLAHAQRATSQSPSTSIYRGASQPAKRQRPTLWQLHDPYGHDVNTSYRALSKAARSVAELANEVVRRTAVQDASRQEYWQRRHKQGGKAKDKGAEGSGDSSENEDAEGSDAPVKMMDSIYSDSSRSSEGYGYGFGNASTSLEQQQAWPKMGSTAPPSPRLDRRGRDMTRMAGRIMAMSTSRSPSRSGTEGPVEGPTNNTPQQIPVVTAVPMMTPLSDPAVGSPARHTRPNHSRSSTRTSRSSHSTRSPAAARGAGIVLLGVTALFGLQHRRPSEAALRFDGSLVSMNKGATMRMGPAVWGSVEAAGQVHMAPLTLEYSPHPYHIFSFNEEIPQPSWERIVGRISAWTCTVLYMTSRLPQIWTNLSRKSVQGLSILLFIAAALGNALYSVSILANPLVSGETGAAYMWESLPFLLGSGGTLVFDAIIVAQWIAWRGNAPTVEVDHHHHAHHTIPPRAFTLRGSSRTSRTNANRWASLERQPLLG